MTGLPSEKQISVALFGEHLPVVEAYAEILATTGLEWGLLGPREAGVIWARHLHNCAVLSPYVPDRSSVGDIGSGAGLPGLVLAIMRPDLRVTLIEPLLRRATFLTEAVDRLTLTNVTVIRSRAEDVRQQFDVVTARAVAPLGRLVKMSAPLVRGPGALLAMKGERAQQELDEASIELRRSGWSGEVLLAGSETLVQPTRIVRLLRLPRPRFTQSSKSHQEES